MRGVRFDGTNAWSCWSVSDRTEGAWKTSMLRSDFIFKLIIWFVCDVQMRKQLALTIEIADCSRISEVWFSEYAEVRIGYCMIDVFF